MKKKLILLLLSLTLLISCSEEKVFEDENFEIKYYDNMFDEIIHVESIDNIVGKEETTIYVEHYKYMFEKDGFALTDEIIIPLNVDEYYISLIFKREKQ